MNSLEWSTALPPEIIEGPLPKVLSDQFMHDLNIYVLGPLYAILSVIGIVTNILNIIVFKALGLQNGTSTIFFMIAILDLWQSWTVLILAFATYLRLFPEVDVEPSSLMFNIHTVRAIAIYLSVFLATVLCVDRCLVVSFPIRFRGGMSVKAAWYTCILGFIFIVFAHIPYMGYIGFTWAFDPTVNRSRYILYQKEGYDELSDVHRIVMGQIFILSKMVLTVGSSIFLIIFLNRSAQFRKTAAAEQSSQEDSGQERSKVLTKIVVVLVIVMATCDAPVLTMSLLEQFYYTKIEGKKDTWNLTVLIYDSDTVTMEINAIANFLIYFKMHAKFHSQIKTLFNSLRKSPPPPQGK